MKLQGKDIIKDGVKYLGKFEFYQYNSGNPGYYFWRIYNHKGEITDNGRWGVSSSSSSSYIVPTVAASWFNPLFVAYQQGHTFYIRNNGTTSDAPYRFIFIRVILKGTQDRDIYIYLRYSSGAVNWAWWTSDFYKYVGTYIELYGWYSEDFPQSISVLKPILESEGII